jgi:hypothetical protein
MKRFILQCAIILFFVFVSIVTFFMAGDWYERHLICLETGRVAMIGQCDTEGFCGVQLYDGAYSEALRPTEGEEVCIKSEFEWSPKHLAPIRRDTDDDAPQGEDKNYE